MADIDIARALKDKTYFNSLTEQQKAIVRQANPAGEADLSDADLDTVSGGLGGGAEAEITSTTTNDPCGCPFGPGTGALAPGRCICDC